TCRAERGRPGLCGCRWRQGACARPGGPRARSGRVPFDRGPVGLREVDAARRTRGPLRADRGQGLLRRPPGVGQGTGRYRGGLPGGCLLPLADRRGQHRIRPAKGGRRRRRGRATGVLCGRLHGPQGFPQGVPGAALGRHAAACVHRPHAGDAAASRPPRRALRRARCADAAAMGDELLRLWRETGATTVMLITHALDEAAMLSDRIGVMSARPGRLIADLRTGWPRERDSRIAAEESFGAITSRLWRRLRDESLKLLPAAVPELVSGLRVGFALTLLGVLIGEMFASQRGLGYLVMNAIGTLDVPTMMAVVLLLALVAVMVSAALLHLDRRLHHRIA